MVQVELDLHMGISQNSGPPKLVGFLLLSHKVPSTRRFTIGCPSACRAKNAYKEITRSSWHGFSFQTTQIPVAQTLPTLLPNLYSVFSGCVRLLPYSYSFQTKAFLWSKRSACLPSQLYDCTHMRRFILFFFAPALSFVCAAFGCRVEGPVEAKLPAAPIRGGGELFQPESTRFTSKLDITSIKGALRWCVNL